MSDSTQLRAKARTENARAGAQAMTAAEQLIQQGRAEGISEGLARQRHLLRRLLELKFGALPADAIAKLEASDESTLERYAERIITAPTLSEVLGN